MPGTDTPGIIGFFCQTDDHYTDPEFYDSPRKVNEWIADNVDAYDMENIDFDEWSVFALTDTHRLHRCTITPGEPTLPTVEVPTSIS